MTDVRTRSEGLPVGMLLAGAGGFLDAFTAMMDPRSAAWCLAAGSWPVRHLKNGSSIIRPRGSRPLP